MASSGAFPLTWPPLLILRYTDMNPCHHLLPPCRLRPAGATGDMSPTCLDVGMDGDLAVYDPARGDRKVFKVDRVFDETATQTGIYEDTQPLIRSVLDGKQPA